jgi:hypothetical protein
MNPWTVLPAIVALGVIYIMLPTGLHAFLRYRPRKELCCPVSGDEARVLIDARRAGLSAALRGHPSLSVRDCSLWPARSGCGRDCLKLPAAEMRQAA